MFANDMGNSDRRVRRTHNIHTLTVSFKVSSFHNVSEDFRRSQKIADVFRPFRALKRSASVRWASSPYREQNISDVFRGRGFQSTF